MLRGKRVGVRNKIDISKEATVPKSHKNKTHIKQISTNSISSPKTTTTMKLAAPLVASLAMMLTAPAAAYNLLGPSFFEPALTFSPFRTARNSLLPNIPDTRAFTKMSPRYEITNTDDKLMIALDVPGVKVEDVDVSVEDNGKILTIRGSRRSQTDNSSFSSSFSQSFGLDTVIDVDNISANLVDGVLTVVAPKDMKLIEEAVRSIPITQNAPETTMAQLNAGTEEDHKVEVQQEDDEEEVNLDAV